MAAAAYCNANQSPPNAVITLTNVCATVDVVGVVNCAAIFGTTYAEALHKVSGQWHDPDNHPRMEGRDKGSTQDKIYLLNNQSEVGPTYVGRNRLQYKQQSADGN